MEREDVDEDTSQNISSSCHSGVAPTRSEPETDLPMSKYPPYLLVGDNLDKNAPHDMRVDNQVKSIHYFHSYAVHDCIDHSQVSNASPESDILSLPVTTFQGHRQGGVLMVLKHPIGYPELYILAIISTLIPHTSPHTSHAHIHTCTGFIIVAGDMEMECVPQCTTG